MKHVLFLLMLLLSGVALANSGGGGGGGAAGYVKIEPLVINLSVPNMISFAPQIKLEDPADEEVIKAYMPVVRFELIKAMIGQEARKVQTPEFMSEFAITAAKALNKALGGEYIKAIFFTEWIVQ